VILLDTNVLSEAMNLKPSPGVLRWLAAQERQTIFTTTVTQAEILYGVEALAPGRRRTQLSMAAEKIFAEEFQGRILPFDESAARAFAKIVAARDAAGRPISQFDAMIAAIARSCGASIATRNAADFERCGIHVINPWSE
jgi:predicted nucleic acid-binding protein